MSSFRGRKGRLILKASVKGFWPESVSLTTVDGPECEKRKEMVLLSGIKVGTVP